MHLLALLLLSIPAAALRPRTPSSPHPLSPACGAREASGAVAVPLPALSPAERVVRASSVDEILAVAAEGALRLPGQELHHYETQYVHMRRRQLTATNALRRLARFLIGAASERERLKVASSTHFQHLCVCALHPLPEDRAEDVINYSDALRSIGQLAPLNHTFVVTELEPMVSRLMPRLLRDVPVTSLTGVDVALYKLGISEAARHPLWKVLDEHRLPFRHHHALVKGQITLQDITREVKFSRDTFTTIGGKRVVERRGTCWMAEEGIGGATLYPTKAVCPHSSQALHTRARSCRRFP